MEKSQILARYSQAHINPPKRGWTSGKKRCGSEGWLKSPVSAYAPSSRSEYTPILVSLRQVLKDTSNGGVYRLFSMLTWAMTIWLAGMWLEERGLLVQLLNFCASCSLSIINKTFSYQGSCVHKNTWYQDTTDHWLCGCISWSVAICAWHWCEDSSRAVTL